MPDRAPDTRHDMLRARYEFKGAAKCKTCQAPTEWWKTTNGRFLMLNPIVTDHEKTVLHRETCGADPNHAPAPAPKEWNEKNPPPITLDQELRCFVERTNARVIVLVDDKGSVFAYRLGISAEDLRHDLITAANTVRAAVNGGAR